MKSLEVSYSRGKHVVSIGDEFFCRATIPPGHYIVEHFGGHHPVGHTADGEPIVSMSSYSPSGLGGTPTITCRHVRSGEMVEFCGDSVAMFVNYPDTVPDGWDAEMEQEQNERNRVFHRRLSSSASTSH